MNSVNLILPPFYSEDDLPIIFLAGPIRGCINWQDEATVSLKQKMSEIKTSAKINVANPRRNLTMIEGGFGDDCLIEQSAWETHYMRKAEQGGVILFWLANEIEHKCSQTYAQTTRFELGEYIARRQFNKSKIVIGIDTRFSNARYIKNQIHQKSPTIPICDTIEKTCDETISILIRNQKHPTTTNY